MVYEKRDRGQFDAILGFYQIIACTSIFLDNGLSNLSNTILYHAYLIDMTLIMCSKTYSDLYELDMGSLEPASLAMIAKYPQIDHSELTWTTKVCQIS